MITEFQVLTDLAREIAPKSNFLDSREVAEWCAARQAEDAIENALRLQALAKKPPSAQGD